MSEQSEHNGIKFTCIKVKPNVIPNDTRWFLEVASHKELKFFIEQIAPNEEFKQALLSLDCEGLRNALIGGMALGMTLKDQDNETSQPKTE